MIRGFRSSLLSLLLLLTVMSNPASGAFLSCYEAGGACAGRFAPAWVSCINSCCACPGFPGVVPLMQMGLIATVTAAAKNKVAVLRIALSAITIAVPSLGVEALDERYGLLRDLKHLLQDGIGKVGDASGDILRTLLTNVVDAIPKAEIGYGFDVTGFVFAGGAFALSATELYIRNGALRSAIYLMWVAGGVTSLASLLAQTAQDSILAIEQGEFNRLDAIVSEDLEIDRIKREYNEALSSPLKIASYVIRITYAGLTVYGIWRGLHYMKKKCPTSLCV